MAGLASVGGLLCAAPAAFGNISLSQLGQAYQGWLRSAPQIQQTSDQICLATPSDSVTLSKPVAAGDTLVLVVAGQGYSSPSATVTGVSDNVNGAWTQLTNAPAVTPDQLHYLSYSVYELAHSAAAPSGLTITVNELPGQSSASAVALEVNGRLDASAFDDSSMQLSSGGVMSAPQASPWADRLDLTLGLFGAYQYGQSFNAGSGWAMSLASNCTAAIAISAGPKGGIGWGGWGAAPLPTVDVSGPTYYLAGTLDFGRDLGFHWLDGHR